MDVRVFKKWLMLVVALSVHVLGYLAVNAFLGRRGLHYDVAIFWDYRIPFIKYFSPFYAMVYLIPLVTFFTVWKDYELIVGIFKAFLGAGLISLTVFLFFPVEFKLRATLIPPYDFFESLVRFFYWADNPPYNCMPSLHVAMAFISARAIYLYRKSWSLWFYTLAGMITLSTVFIRQHYILDLAAGIVVSVLMIILFLPRRLGEEIRLSKSEFPATPAGPAAVRYEDRYSR